MTHRRDILKFALAGALALGRRAARARAAVPARAEAADGEPRIRRYNDLGKTGLRVSDVGFGVAVSTDPRLLVEAFHRGINYFDVVPFYSWSLDMLTRAFALDADMRRNAIVATKVECTNFFFRFTKEPLHKVIVECTEKTLKSLGRDHLDIMQIHSVGEGGEQNLEWLDPTTELGSEAAKLFEILKAQGKVRFAGISSHGPRLLETAAEKAITCGRFDMVMLALNFMQSPGLARVLRLAKDRGVGVIAMKALANARNLKVPGLSGKPFSHAALAWALAQEGVNGAVITIPDREHLNEYLGASGGMLTALDRIRLRELRAATDSRYCRVGCGACLGSCPNGVDIASILRFDQYRSDYGWLDFARERYHAFPATRRPERCLDCEASPCEGACPFGISIRSRLVAAHGHLASGGKVIA